MELDFKEIEKAWQMYSTDDKMTKTGFVKAATKLLTKVKELKP